MNDALKDLLKKELKEALKKTLAETVKQALEEVLAEVLAEATETIKPQESLVTPPADLEMAVDTSGAVTSTVEVEEKQVVVEATEPIKAKRSRKKKEIAPETATPTETPSEELVAAESPVVDITGDVTHTVVVELEPVIVTEPPVTSGESIVVQEVAQTEEAALTTEPKKKRVRKTKAETKPEPEIQAQPQEEPTNETQQEEPSPSLFEKLKSGLEEAIELELTNKEETKPAKKLKKKPLEGNIPDEVLGLAKELSPEIVSQIKQSFDDVKCVTFQVLDKDPILLSEWTDKVAMWRFFERYISAYERKNKNTLKMEIDKSLPLHYSLNPFAEYGAVFEVVRKAWSPLINNVILSYAQKSAAGSSIKSELKSVAEVAFLHALEKQAMAVLAGPKEYSKSSFPVRLKFALQKIIRAELPDIVGDVRVPIDVGQMQSYASLETITREGPKRDGGV